MHRASNPLNDAAEGQLVALRFGPFELDVRSGELRRNGTTVRLQPQPSKVLVLLTSRPGDVVTREEIQAEVWPAGTFVDFEQSLNFCIRQIRAALGDNANAPRYLETLPRRGYRWVGGPVERVGAGVAVREWPRPVATEPRVPQPPGERAEPPPLPVARPGLPETARRWWPVAVALALAAFAAWAWLPPRRPAAPPPDFQRLTFRRGAINSARFGPDGEVVYSASWDGGPRAIQVVRTDQRDSRALGITDARVAAVSPAGEVAFLRDGVLARAPLSGGPPKDVLKDVVAADWTADGSEFAVVRTGDGEYRLEFPVGRVLARVAGVNWLRLAPGGRFLAIAEHPIMDDDRGVVAILDRDGRRVASTEEWASLDGIAWAPGGREVWFTASSVGADNSVHALGLDGRVRSVLSGMGRLVLHDVAPDGRVLLERTSLRAEMLFRRASEPEDRDLSWLDFSTAEGIAPDGSTVLFYESGQGGGPDYATFLRRTDGSLPVHLGHGRALDLSPDGRWVLSVSLRKPDSVELTPTGPGESRRIRVPGVVAHEAAGFVAGGDRIFLTGRDAAGRRATWLTTLDGGAPQKLPLPDGRILLQNTFSPDGARFVAPCPKREGACFFDTVAGNPVAVPGTQKGWWPVGWDASGRLYFRDRTKRVPETLVRLDPATGRATPLAELAPRDRAGVLGVMSVMVARGGDAWTYNVMRRLSDLHIVTGVR
jgi:DNA-binding winged helix-turn-helix (wHTH) protein